jgi:lysyl-tRNA synthetase class I
MPKRASCASRMTGETSSTASFRRQAKLQWKVDWAMRWVALGVDYEMYGKDLTDSGAQSGKIAQVLGGRKPEGLIYEMFLDEKGEKISKSKGNGLSLEEWLTYGSEESLAFYAYREPKSAKQLHFGVIPRAVDEYWQFRGNYASQPLEQAARQSGAPYPCGAMEAVPTDSAAGELRPAAQSRRRDGRAADARSRCGPIWATMSPMRSRSAPRSSPRWSTTRSPTTAISSRRR